MHVHPYNLIEMDSNQHKGENIWLLSRLNEFLQ